MRFNAAKIVRKIKSGISLSEAEKNYLEVHIQHPVQEDDLYDLIRGFCFTFPPTDDNKSYVEQYLSFDKDDLILSVAIEGLCSFWKLTKSYIEFLKELFIRENAVTFSESHIKASSALGYYLFDNEDTEVLSYLFNLFLSELKVHEADKDDLSSILFISSLYQALETSIRGKEATWDHLINASREMNFPEDINHDIMIEIASRIMTAKAQQSQRKQH